MTPAEVRGILGAPEVQSTMDILGEPEKVTWNYYRGRYRYVVLWDYERAGGATTKMPTRVFQMMRMPVTAREWLGLAP